MDEKDAQATHEMTAEALDSRSDEELAADIEATRGRLRDIYAGPQKPSVGRIVHFVQRDGRHLAAIIVGGEEGYVDLHVFPHRTGRGEWCAAHDVDGIAEDGEKDPHTWHWPERE